MDGESTSAVLHVSSTSTVSDSMKMYYDNTWIYRRKIQFKEFGSELENICDYMHSCCNTCKHQCNHYACKWVKRGHYWTNKYKYKYIHVQMYVQVLVAVLAISVFIHFMQCTYFIQSMRMFAILSQCLPLPLHIIRERLPQIWKFSY